VDSPEDNPEVAEHSLEERLGSLAEGDSPVEERPDILAEEGSPVADILLAEEGSLVEGRPAVAGIPVAGILLAEVGSLEEDNLVEEDSLVEGSLVEGDSPEEDMRLAAGMEQVVLEPLRGIPEQGPVLECCSGH